MKKLLKRIIRNLYGYFSINWFQFIKYYNKNADYVVLLNLRKFRHSKMGSHSFDIGYIKSLCKNRVPFKITRNPGNLADQKIFWYPSKELCPWSFSDYAKTIIHIADQLESNNNELYPSKSEVSFLENKTFMYKAFAKSGIRHPKTWIFESKKDLENCSEIKFPYLIKGEHSSGSQDINKISNKSDLLSLFEKTNFLKRNKNIIVQELIDMRRDLRVTIVNDEVVLAFWRINYSDEWRPTASKFGSKVSFEDYPKEWEGHFIESLKKLNLNMGAFDVVWENDDVSKEPMYLEVSPGFSPNPKVDLSKKKYEYGEFKKKWLFHNDFEIKQSKLIFEICHKYVSEIIKL